MIEGEQQQPGNTGAHIQVRVDFVPRHYNVAATVSQDGMRRIIVGLRRLVDEYDCGEECELMLATFEESYSGDLPTAPGPAISDDESSATA